MAAIETQKPNWTYWRKRFETRANRELPTLDTSADYSELPASLARSLAVFQLGESGGGTVIEQANESALDSVNEDYAEAVRLFVAEEHRHANLLAMCVRLLGGELIRKNWTQRLFLFSRRLIGLRLKVLVLLAAEVVGICYYSSIAAKLGPGPVRRWLSEMVEDERSHLEFHCLFLQSQVTSAWRRRLFTAVWRIVMVTAAIVVMIDHRQTIKDLGLGFRCTWQRWMAFSQMGRAARNRRACHLHKVSGGLRRELNHTDSVKPACTIDAEHAVIQQRENEGDVLARQARCNNPRRYAGHDGLCDG